MRPDLRLSARIIPPTAHCPLLTVLSLFLACAGCKKAEQPPVLIGQITSLSGPRKEIGKSVWQAVILAVEEANKDPINGKKVAVLTADNRGEEDLIKSEAARLAAVNDVTALLGGIEVSGSDGVATTAQAHQTPAVLSGGWPDQAINDYVFQTGIPPAYLGKILARFAIQEKKLTSAMIVAAESERGKARYSATAEAFSKEFRQGGGTIAGELTFKMPGEMKGLVRQIQEKKPGCLFFAGPHTDLLELSKAGLDEKMPIFFAGEEQSAAEWRSNPLFIGTPYVLDRDKVRAADFAAKYQDRFGSAPDAHAQAAYDNATILFEGLRRAKSFEGAKVRKELAELKDFESLTGPLSFGKDLWASRPVFIVSVENKQAKTMTEYKPE